MLYVRFPLSLRNVEDLLHERENRFGPIFAGEIRRKRARRLPARKLILSHIWAGQGADSSMIFRANPY